MVKTVVWETDVIKSGIEERIRQMGRRVLHSFKLHFDFCLPIFEPTSCRVKPLSLMVEIRRNFRVWESYSGYKFSISVNFVEVKGQVKIDNPSSLSKYVHWSMRFD